MTHYTVTKSSPVLLPPAGPTPSETLPLSSIDRAMPSRIFIDLISVFLHGEQPVMRIKDAFAKALVHYYPVAGRVSEETLGEPVVDCSAEGIWFVEAMMNCSLKDVNHMERPLMISKEEMLPQPPAGVKFEDQILMVQISEFRCGGFVVGICFSHLIFDGQGAGQFLKAVGEMAQGLPEPSVKPIWSRESIPNPPKVHFRGPSPSPTKFNFVTTVVEISHDSVNNMKEKFMSKTGKICSSFDVITALIFKSRAKAIKLALNAEVHLSIAANTRHLLHSVLPSVEGYYGNCLNLIGITKTTEEINNTSLVEVITLIKDAKESLSRNFEDWMNGRSYTHYMPMDYGTIMVSDWRWLGFNEVDFGWGNPKCVFYANNDCNFFGIGTYLKPPLPNQGIRLILRCVEEEHATEFVDELQRLQMIKFSK